MVKVHPQLAWSCRKLRLLVFKEIEKGEKMLFR
jgi:hypothetical protein